VARGSGEVRGTKNQKKTKYHSPLATKAKLISLKRPKRNPEKNTKAGGRLGGGQQAGPRKKKSVPGGGDGEYRGRDAGHEETQKKSTKKKTTLGFP